MRSGHPDKVYAVTNPAAIIATFATASFRAERNAARVKLPLCDRKRARINAQRPDRARVGRSRLLAFRHEARFQFHSRQLFIRAHDETFFVAAMRVCNPDCVPAKIHS
jgi:hypothetical protein